jgi:hypothetical protein
MSGTTAEGVRVAGRALRGMAFWTCAALALGSVVLAVRSYFMCERFGRQGSTSAWVCSSGFGLMHIGRVKYDPTIAAIGELGWKYHRLSPSNLSADWMPRGRAHNLLRFQAGRESGRLNDTTFVTFPHWTATAFFGLWPGIRLWRWSRLRRIPEGHCAA